MNDWIQDKVSHENRVFYIKTFSYLLINFQKHKISNLLLIILQKKIQN